MSVINFHNVDCIEFMKGKPDKFYDLAIVDPPYGINWTKTITCTTEKQILHNKKTGYKVHSNKNWDTAIPTKEYWDELFRVSKNQIVWGGNYMTEFLPPSRCWIVWNKMDEVFTAISNELAWTSFNKKIKIFSRLHAIDKGFMNHDGGGIHPTEKPVFLYRWLLVNYAEKGMKLLDTHGGSMSIALACHKEGFDLDLCEIDEEYFKKGTKRYNDYIQQLTMNF